MKESNLSKVALLFGRLAKLLVANPRGFRELCGTALAQSENLIRPDGDVSPIPAIALADLVAGEPEMLNVNVCAFPQERFSISLEEAVGLAILVKKSGARRIFEFGTYRGVSTAQLASNLSDQGEIITLDLPAENADTQFAQENTSDVEIARFRRKGDLIPELLRQKIRFLAQDSAAFDPKPYEKSMDFIFIDGAHSYEYVLNDSEKAWVMLRPGGIAAWHDCRPQNPGVVKYLRSCKYHPRRILGTTLAFAVKPRE